MTNNNHESMKTVVETFLTEETVGLIYDNEQLDKWNAHVESLGLKGQTQIVKKDKSPIPFMHLKKSYVNICETLCPRKVAIETYNITPIPIEILELAALSKKEGYFSRLEVWYDEQSPDPFVVGICSSFYCYDKGYRRLEGLENLTLDEAKKEKETNESVYAFLENITLHYLIGKWADVKHSWKELKEMATERYITSKGNEYRQLIKDNQRRIEDLENEAFLLFS